MVKDTGEAIEEQSSKGENVFCHSRFYLTDAAATRSHAAARAGLLPLWVIPSSGFFVCLSFRRVSSISIQHS